MEDVLNLRLRKANINDSRFLWHLRNQKQVRENSFNTKRILYKDHLNWLNNVLKDKNVYLYVIQDTNQPIGQIRFGVKKEKAFVNISISRNFRNRGLGRKILKTASRHFLKNKSLKAIVAYVKEENIASLICFQKAGYARKGKKVINGCNFQRLNFLKLKQETRQ